MGHPFPSSMDHPFPSSMDHPFPSSMDHPFPSSMDPSVAWGMCGFAPHGLCPRAKRGGYDGGMPPLVCRARWVCPCAVAVAATQRQFVFFSRWSERCFVE
ncbi:unnamed protein product [Discosporangium mesarthrocarpum]